MNDAQHIAYMQVERAARKLLEAIKLLNELGGVPGDMKITYRDRRDAPGVPGESYAAKGEFYFYEMVGKSPMTSTLQMEESIYTRHDKKS